MDPRRLGLSREDLEALGYRVGEEGEGDEELEIILNKVARSGGGDDDGPAGEDSPRGRATAQRMWFWTLVALLIVGWVTSVHLQLPSPVPANRPDSIFSSARAMSQLVEIAREPHPPGAPESERVRGYLMERLRTLGLDPQTQTTTSVTQEGESVLAVGVTNIVARVPGRASTGAVAVTAHYDSTPLSAGAGDSGVGVAAILETVRAILAGEMLRNDFIILLADGGTMEQAGLRAFVEEHPWMEDIRLAISLEMHGVSGPAITFEVQPENGRLIQEVALANPRPVASSLARVLTPPEALGKDLSPFQERGIPGLNLTGLGGRAAHNQATDRAEAVDERTLAHHGLQLLALARHFGEADLGPSSEWTGPDQVYLSFRFFGLVHHDADRVHFISLGLLLAWILVLAIFKIRRGRFFNLLIGLTLGMAVVLGSAGLGWALFENLKGFHPEYGFLESAFNEDRSHFLALAGLVLALVTGAFGLARRWIEPEGLFLGALLVPLGFSLWGGFHYPLGIFTLQWPLALSLFSALLWVGLGSRRLSGRWGWSVTLLVSAGIVSVLLPNLEILATILTFREATLFGGAVSMGLILLFPILDRLTRPRVWLTPTLAVVAALILEVGGSPAIRGPAHNPEFSSLILLVEDSLEGPEADSLTLGAFGYETTSTETESDSLSARRVAGRWLTIPGPGEAWARSWVAEPETGPTDPGVLLLPQEDRYSVVGSGPETYMAPPQLWILKDSVLDGRRSLHVAVRSGLGGELMGLHLPDQLGGFTSIDGFTWEREAASGPARTLTYWGDPARDVFSVGIDLPLGQDTVELEILEHHLRPREVLGRRFFRRNQTLIPNAPAGSDRIIQRIRVRLALARG